MDDKESETTEDNLINMDVSRYQCVFALFFSLAILHPNTRTLSLFQKQESPNLYLSLPMKHYSLKKRTQPTHFSILLTLQCIQQLKPHLSSNEQCTGF